jgi:hypothetical protein
MATFGATYPGKLYPIVQKLAKVVMSILPRVTDYLEREQRSALTMIVGGGCILALSL